MRPPIKDKVVGVLAERVEVEAVEPHPEISTVLVTLRLPDGISEQSRLETQEWVQVQLWDLQAAQAADGVVFVPRYV